MKYLILGAGPTGLSLACSLMKKGITDFLVLEKESEAGGLCRSKEVDGSAFDIGGGHFLDVRRPKVDEFLFEYLPESEWNVFDRDSRISVNGNLIGHPFEANIWQFPIDDQIEYLKSIAQAGCNTGTEMPKKFTEWITWKLGDRIAEDYMLPYNQKMFEENLDNLGTYWLEKLPDVSFEDTLRSCLEHHAYGKQPGHARFLYPKKYGYGEVWLRMAESIKDKIIYNTSIDSLDVKNKVVNGEYTADIIINTVPWTSISNLVIDDKEVINNISKLSYSTVITEYHPENLNTEAHWIYYPDKKLDYHRILVRHNFCEGSKGYWTETNSERYHEVSGRTYFTNEYAYPLNTIDKQEAIGYVLQVMQKFNIYGLGRWGEWQHYNSDVVVERAMNFAESLISGGVK